MRPETRIPTGRLLALLVLSGAACTKIVGLPDLPEPATGGSGNPSEGGANGGGASGRGGSAAAAAGGSSAGKSGGASPTGGTSSGDAGDTNGAGAGGSSPCGSACAGSAITGGSTSGGQGGATSSGGAGGASGGAGGSSASGGSGANGGSGGTGGSDSCDPPCTGNTVCKGTECGCDGTLTLCTDECVDTESDRDHCKSCIDTCPEGCSASRCFETLMNGEGPLNDWAINPTDIYFTRGNDGAVYRISRSGGSVTPVDAGQPNAHDIIVDDTNLYWSNTGVVGQVMKRPLSGGPTEELVPNVDAGSLVVDGTNVYFATADEFIYMVPIAGGDKVELASGAEAENVENMIIGAATLYWSSTSGNGSFYKLALGGGGSPSLIKSGLVGASNRDSTVLAGPDLYFMYYPDAGDVRVIGRMNVDSGEVSTVLNAEGSMLAMDTTGFYVADGDAETIVKINLSGTTFTKLVQEKQQIGQMGLSGIDVYWTNQDGDIRFTSRNP